MQAASMEWVMDLGDAKSIDELDHGGKAPDGWHKATLAKVDDDQDGNKKLVFEITSAKAPGAKITQTISNPHLIDDPSKAKKAVERSKFVATRLGLITPDMVGKNGAIIKWDAATGREYAIKVETRTMPKKDDGSGGNEFTGLAYSGICPIDHPDVPNSVRAELGLPPARVRVKSDGPVAASAPAAAPKVDLDNLFGK